jgi:hypothetical protein
MAWKVLSLSITQEINSICNDLKVSTTRVDSVVNTYTTYLTFQRTSQSAYATCIRPRLDDLKVQFTFTLFIMYISEDRSNFILRE